MSEPPATGPGADPPRPDEIPTRPERERLWRETLRDDIGRGDLDPGKLAAVALTGGTIADIARRGAYLAAAEGSPVEMRHLRDGTQRELRKAGRELAPEELAAWS